jgi:isopenicillin N synthase-like dioxygenase
MSMTKAFFDLPELEKRKIDKSHSPHFRGWEQLGSELTNNQTDYREQIDIGIDGEAIANPDPYYMALVGPNQWPEESMLPGFRNTVVSYIEQLSDVSRHLLAIMSVSLGLHQNHIQSVFGKNPSPYTKLIRYPETIAGTQGVGVHKDSGFLTLLLQDENGGLEAQANDDQWHAVDPLPGSLVVNTGELLQLVTRNYFIATPHRVINRNTNPRYSSAFFYSPDLTTRLDPLPIKQEFVDAAARSPRHNNEGLMASRQEMLCGKDSMGSTVIPAVFGEKYWQRWVRSYPDIARHYYPENA